jgi:hypothetical protein
MWAAPGRVGLRRRASGGEGVVAHAEWKRAAAMVGIRRGRAAAGRSKYGIEDDETAWGLVRLGLKVR